VDIPDLPWRVWVALLTGFGAGLPASLLWPQCWIVGLILGVAAGVVWESESGRRRDGNASHSPPLHPIIRFVALVFSGFPTFGLVSLVAPPPVAAIVLVVAPIPLGIAAAAIVRQPVPMRLRLECSIAFGLALAITWLLRHLIG
jgi:hypothetical protein